MDRTDPNLGKPHRPVRLPLEAYWEPGTTWLVTIVTEDRKPAFSSWPLADCVAEQIVWYCHRYHLALHAWVILPEHIHFIAQVGEGSKGIVAMCQSFKSFTTRLAWEHGDHGTLWQRSFHDHGIRQVEDFNDLARYVFNNPVRLGIVGEAETYRWRGGLAFDDPLATFNAFPIPRA